jgi:hypothetical protein
MDSLQVVEGSRETLIHGLSFVQPAEATYLKDRTAATFFAVGGNSYSPSGVRLLRFQLTSSGDDFLDPGSVRLAFTLVNEATAATATLRLLSDNPLCVFQRMRILARGSWVEDISYLHRTVELFSILTPPERRKAVSSQMMGEIMGGDASIDINPEGVAPNSSRKVLVALPSGLLSAAQEKMIPLKRCDLTVELEINSNVAQYLSTVEGNSTLWRLEDAQLKCDLLNVASQIADPIYGLVDGGGIEFKFKSINNTMNMLPGVAPRGEFSTQWAKSFNDIVAIFLTFGTPEYEARNPVEQQTNETNGFYYPSRSTPKGTAIRTGRAYSAADDQTEVNLHVGARRLLQYPSRSLAEHHYRLMHCLGLSASAEGIAIHPARYRSDQFVLGFDCEKAGSDPANVSQTGINTAVGNSTIRLEMKGLNAFPGEPTGVNANGSHVVDRVYCHIVHSVGMMLQAGGVTVSE